MGPIQYLPPVQQDQFLQSLMSGLQVGTAFRKNQEEAAAAEAARQAQEQYRLDIGAALQNPTPQAFASLAVKYPQHREAYKQSWEQLNGEQQRAELQDMTTLAAALQSGSPDVALTKLEERAQAMRNAGKSTTEIDFLRQQIQADPRAAYGSVLRVLSGIPGGDKVLGNLTTIGTEERAQAKAPFEVRTAAAGATKAEADARAATTDADLKAKYGEQTALLDLQKKGWDIKAIENDIAVKREANRIAAMNAATARANSDLQRQELSLKVRDAQSKLDSTIREKVATAEAGAASIDNMLNTIERIKGNKSLDDVIGSFEGSLPRMVTSGLDDEESDAIALIETLGSQAFLAQIPNIKGMGALSNAEGDKLQSALQNLGRAQGEKQFRANLDEAARLLKKGRESLAKSSGVPLGKPDTPAAPGSRPPLSSFNKP